MIRQGSGNPFALSEATFSMVGIAITGRFAVNLFGYVGGGFRRCLLLPTEPAAALRAGSYLFVSLGVVLISLGAGAWCLLSRAPFDGRALIMLVGASVTSLFLFHGVAIWTAILGARRGNYQDKVFRPAFTNPFLDKLDDQAVVQVNGTRLAFTTDRLVVTPIFFPGGDIGRLAINGTVNDLAMERSPTAVSGRSVHSGRRAGGG